MEHTIKNFRTPIDYCLDCDTCGRISILFHLWIVFFKKGSLSGTESKERNLAYRWIFSEVFFLFNENKFQISWWERRNYLRKFFKIVFSLCQRIKACHSTLLIEKKRICLYFPKIKKGGCECLFYWKWPCISFHLTIFLFWMEKYHIIW